MGVELKRYEEKKSEKNIYNLEKWLSGLRRQTVNLLSFLIAGSNPAFSIFNYRNITQR